jgi:hypothetical protein
VEEEVLVENEKEKGAIETTHTETRKGINV